MILVEVKEDIQNQIIVLKQQMHDHFLGRPTATFGSEVENESASKKSESPDYHMRDVEVGYSPFDCGRSGSNARRNELSCWKTRT